MKKRLWAVACLILSLCLLAVVAGTVLARESSVEEKSRELDGLYTGAATLSSSSCFDDGDCFTCTADAQLQLTRGNGKITILADGPSITYTPCTYNTSETLRWTVTGSYEMTEAGISSFTLDSCNDGRFGGSGSGTIDGETINVSFSCKTDEYGSAERWSNVVFTKQADGTADEEGEEDGGDEITETVDDPNAVDAGETSDGITVDKLVGDAKVSKLVAYPNRHKITTGPNSKAKIHYGDSEIVIGPNSELVVRTASNKFGDPVIMWEFINPEAVIYVKDKLHGTRQEESGAVPGSATKRIFTNFYRSIMIFYNGSYQGKEDLSEFYGGETNQPEFTNPNNGDRTVIVGIKGTEFYFQGEGSSRTLFLLDGDVDLYNDVNADAVALTAGSKAPVDDAGAIGDPAGYTDAEIEVLAAAVDLTGDPAGDGGLSIKTIVAIAAGVAAVAGTAILIPLLIQSRRGRT